MSEREGVIKYQLSHQYAPLPAQIDTVELNAWRQLLQRLQLIGQAPDRYDGLGFGNVSQRLIPGENQFFDGFCHGDAAVRNITGRMRQT